MILILSADKFCLGDLSNEFFHKDQETFKFSLDNLEKIKNIFVITKINLENTLKRINTFKKNQF